MLKKIVFTIGLVLVTLSANAQGKILKDAEISAKENNKLILIKFSGSDWCAPCIALKKAIFDKPDFETYAEENLIVLTADFPRQKKNQLPKEIQDQNDNLAERYNPEGKFPYLVLIDSDGNVLKVWNGFDKKLTVENYIEDIDVFHSQTAE